MSKSFEEEATSIILVMSASPWGRKEAIAALIAANQRSVEEGRINELEELLANKTGSTYGITHRAEERIATLKKKTKDL